MTRIEQIKALCDDHSIPLVPELLEMVEVMSEALEIIAKSPDLPNPDRDADWKNCMKWSSHEAKEALSKYKEWNEGV